jgi:hypothetical protein
MYFSDLFCVLSYAIQYSFSEYSMQMQLKFQYNIWKVVKQFSDPVLAAIAHC